MNIHIKHFFLIVASLLLAAISSCSSVNKTKTKTDDRLTTKTNEVENTTTSNTINNNGVVNRSLLEDRYNNINNLSIEYSPEYDAFGNFIPFSFYKIENGKETRIDIKGPGKVSSSDNTEQSKSTTKEDITYQTKVDSLSTVVSSMQAELDYLRQTNNKEVEKAPDYFKYILWIGIAVLLLTAIIITIYIYFKSTLGKYKTIIDNIKNNL